MNINNITGGLTQVNAGYVVNSQTRVADPARGERWAGFNGYAEDILREMRAAGFSEEEIAQRRLHRALGSYTDTNMAKRNLMAQRAAGASMRTQGPPSAEMLNHTENILLRLIPDAQNTTDELHQTHWLRALQNHLTDTRNMMGGSRFSTSM